MNATDRIIWAKTGKGMRIGMACDMIPALRCMTMTQWLGLQARTIGFDFNVNQKESVQPEINHGRWIVKCPGCNGAEDVSPADPVFYCLSCGNALGDGRIMKVDFPANYVEIEKVLLKRPEMENRNWQSGESLDDLMVENEKHGLDSTGNAN